MSLDKLAVEKACEAFCRVTLRDSGREGQNFQSLPRHIREELRTALESAVQAYLESSPNGS